MIHAKYKITSLQELDLQEIVRVAEIINIYHLLCRPMLKFGGRFSTKTKIALLLKPSRYHQNDISYAIASFTI